MADRYYTESHEWVLVDGDIATIGITDFAQAQLGDVVFLELPAPDKALEAGDNFGVIESVKAASDLYSPVAGTVLEANPEVSQRPELVNADPLGRGWLIKVRLNGEATAGLLDEMGYESYVAGLQ
ncbi:MAG TPA: glycine cleavage system protein GcvH [Candidatus Nitrosotalea sp.]|nr:glycine cleavage system protein GcvH [Candidatus Nitrosotalea sp.]